MFTLHLCNINMTFPYKPNLLWDFESHNFVVSFCYLLSSFVPLPWWVGGKFQLSLSQNGSRCKCNIILYYIISIIYLYPRRLICTATNLVRSPHCGACRGGIYIWLKALCRTACYACCFFSFQLMEVIVMLTLLGNTIL